MNKESIVDILFNEVRDEFSRAVIKYQYVIKFRNTLNSAIETVYKGHEDEINNLAVENFNEFEEIIALKTKDLAYEDKKMIIFGLRKHFFLPWVKLIGTIPEEKLLQWWEKVKSKIQKMSITELK